MSASVLSTRLSNGLTVLSREVHDAPVATFWVWYRVGGRNEVAGVTGISHWVEHMLFKGTPTFGKGMTAREVTKNGGTFNGFTWIDYTAFYETLPSDRIDLALRIESDRMVNSVFDPDEVASERTVILSEREGNENYPTFHLGEEVAASAFKVHPYGQGVIGWTCDLQTMTRADLYGWYKSHYTPNNAVAVAVGDFRTDDLLKRIEELFGAIPAGAELPPLRSVEPPQSGERRVEVRRPGPTPYLEVAYHSPAASDPDAIPMMVLDAVLSGAKSMGMGGREGALGRSSRLYRRLVESGLTSGAGSSFGLTSDPYLFGISATLRPSADLPSVERAVLEEIARVQESGVTADEMAKVRKQVHAQLAYGSEGVSSQAYWLGSLELVHTHELFDDLLARVDAVEAADVQRVAQKYLGENNRTVGWFVPTTATGGADGPAAAPAVRRAADDARTEPQIARAPVPPFGVQPSYLSGPRPLTAPSSFPIPLGGWGVGGVGSGSAGSSPHLDIRRESLPNGIAVLGHVNPDLPSVVVRASIRAGSIFDPADKPGLASFTARTLQRGTLRHTFAELNELTDSIGATLSVDGLNQIAQVSVRCLVDDFDRMVDLLAEVLREPAFPEAEVEIYRSQVLTRLREQQDDTGTVAEKLFFELAYPADHPYHHWQVGDERSVAGFTLADFQGFHRERFRPAGMNVTVAGGIPFDRALERLRSALGDWTDDASAASIQAPPAPRPNGIVRRNVALAGKSQADIVMGLPTLSRKSPDYYSLSFASLVLGGLGLMGRLGDVVRDQQGLAYHVSCGLDSVLGPGAWEVHAGVNARSVDAAIASILGEIRRIQNEPITDAELADGKSYLTGVLPLALETSGGVARFLQQIEVYDLGLDYLEKYAAAIAALTKADIQAAAQRYISADDLVVVVAG